MGTKLMSFALREEVVNERLVAEGRQKLRLTGKTLRVFLLMCRYADDRTGRFYKSHDKFLEEDVKNIKTRSALRNHLSKLERMGYIALLYCSNSKNLRWRSAGTTYQILHLEGLSAKALDDYYERYGRHAQRLQGRLALLESMPGGQADAVGSADAAPAAQLEIPETSAEAAGAPMSDQAAVEPDLPVVSTGNESPAPPVSLVVDNADFFDMVSAACAGIGISGVTAADFSRQAAKLRSIRRKLDSSDAKWIANQVKYASFEKPVTKGLVIHIADKFLSHGAQDFFVENTPYVWGPDGEKMAVNQGSTGARRARSEREGFLR